MLGSAIAMKSGVLERASQQVNEATGFPSMWTAAYAAYLTAFPLVMLVLFVGRNPALLWSRGDE